MRFIDLHCDTLMTAYIQKSPSILSLPKAMVDVQRMKEGGALAQFFAMFLPPPDSAEKMGLSPIDDEEYLAELTAIFNHSMQQASELIAPAYCLTDLLTNRAAEKMSGFLTIEDGRSVLGELSNIKRYYDMGVRLISLTWNQENCFGAPNSSDPAIMAKGLTPFGKEAVVYMQELGMLVDVSHLSDGGFMDVASICKKPFIASHSNARSLSPHQRNLTDDMIRILSNKGGVMGINFAPEFLSEDITNKNSTVDLMCRHIHHIVQVGGVDCVALGSDFDGISGNMEIPQVSQMQQLLDRLKKEGFSQLDLEKIAYKNAMRLIGESMK